ncbi:MAG TPA: histidine phosphatase family protein [Candidatus Acidoferrales bacterium]|nr:histidine phosphatase family protein [Candidatus Acidoferrales bacterium]
MLLYLVRHGVAVPHDDPSCPPDPERPLTPKGFARTKEAARGLAELGVHPRVMVTSPLLRAVQTAEIFCEVLDFSVTKLRRSEALTPASKPALFFAELARLKGAEVMCFGHAPNLDEVIALAAGRGNVFTALKKAGVALLELESIDPPKGLLASLYNPRILRLLAK